MEQQFQQVTSLICDPVRAKMLWALLDGKAYTATELAMNADISPQNASMHLNKLLQADLLRVETQGRHRYFTFSRQDVAYAIEALANLIPYSNHEKNVDGETTSVIKYCRTCYDHLAGKVGVLITDSLLKQKFIIKKENDFEVTVKGIRWFAEMKINTDELKLQRRAFAKACLDWSERRHHISGALGAALLDKMLAADWLRRTKNSRAMLITSKGRKALYECFKVQV
jgi:DNA-binding transcriptional ArsR family regulator